MRYYTTPSVNEARQSVFWSLLFIFLLYFTAPALAVLVKFEIYNNVVGSAFANLPAWVAAWAKIDPTLMNISDINKDGIVQLAEIALGQDIIVWRRLKSRACPTSSRVCRGRRTGSCAFDGRRPAADDRQRAFSRPVLQDDQPQRLDAEAGHGVEDPVVGRGTGGGLGNGAEAGRHPVPGGRGVFAGGCGVLPGSRSRCVLEARQQGRSNRRHAGWTRHHDVLHGNALPLLPEGSGLAAADNPLWYGIQPISSAIFGIPAASSRFWSSAC